MTGGSAEFITRIIHEIRAADREGVLSEKGLDVLDGLSGRRTIGVLQRLTALFHDDANGCYLEVGVYQGLTLLAVATNCPKVLCFGIDNFSLLDPERENLDILLEKMAKLDVRNAFLINEDFEEAFGHLDDYLQGKKITVYFVDGAHDYRSQLMGLILALPYLHDRVVIVVDDANFQFVRQSTHDFLTAFPEFKMVFEAYSPAHPANLKPTERAKWENGWLNGINILIRDSEDLLPTMMPETHRNPMLYVNEWLIHRAQMAELAPEALALAQAICLGDERQEQTLRETLLGRFETMRNILETRYPDRNTYSVGLPESHFNNLRKKDTKANHPRSGGSSAR